MMRDCAGLELSSESEAAELDSSGPGDEGVTGVAAADVSFAVVVVAVIGNDDSRRR
jgi:hypothetical protein